MKRIVIISVILGLVSVAGASVDGPKNQDDQPAIAVTGDVVVGKQVTIVLASAVDEINITYMPNSTVMQTETIKTGGKLEVAWKPKREGLAVLTADTGTTKVSVGYDGVPPLGLAIFLVAFVVLFGGAALCFKSLMSASPDQ